jgi:uncharacterized protein YdeI (YjbR/CyaY-like superfamily)
VTTTAQWRAWLAANPDATEVWLDMDGLSYEEAVEQALCFGWIDGLHRAGRLRFTPRKQGSSWSALNRERAARMIEQGLMTEAGQAAIEEAKARGLWHVDATMPPELQALLDADGTARSHFERFPPSTRRLILEWIATAKKPETRQRRITQTAELAAQGIRAR